MVSTTTLLVMVYFVVEGINDGGVKGKDPSSSSTF